MYIMWAIICNNELSSAAYQYITSAYRFELYFIATADKFEVYVIASAAEFELYFNTSAAEVKLYFTIISAVVKSITLNFLIIVFWHKT